MSYYAIDFGTSNSLLNYISSSGEVTQVPLEHDGGFVLRSLLFTPQKGKWYFGEEAINAYMDYDGEGRFFRSLKKFLPEPNYTGSEVHNQKLKIEDLISIFLKEMRLRADKYLNLKVDKLVLGRPAKYSLRDDNDQLAQDRMRKASELAGFNEIHFCPEPLAAGLDYSNKSGEDKNVLIADFGGGTSDFTLMKFHAGEYSQDDILGLSGIFQAGDALDGEFMLKFIAKHFGADFSYQLTFGNNILKFPKNLLQKICSPAHITHLRERDTWEFLQAIQKFSLDADNKKKLDQLFTLVECQLGFPIFDKIEQTKIQISKGDEKLNEFKFTYPGIHIEEQIERNLYFEQMSSVIDQIFASLMEVFEQSGTTPSDVHEICITGGTAQFPLIQKRLEEIFGSQKIVQHDIYQSVVGGLAQFAKKLL